MFKKYFTDGLIQVAIVLSLMRTDLNDYLNSMVDTFTQENLEVHGVIHGPTSAYAPANFHSNRLYHSDFNIAVHPKNIDNIISSSILSDLHALGNLRRYNVETNIAAYIVGEHGTPGLWDTQPENDSVPQVNLTDHPNVSSGNNTAVHPPNSPLHTESENPSDFSESDSNYGSELTMEDMDLIDILWRQDMDMGVSKDTFTSTLRKELEKPDEELKVKVEKDGSSEAVPTTELPPDETEEDNITYIVDDETGELVPAPPGTVLPLVDDSQPMDTSTHQLGEEQGQLLEEAISILQAEAVGSSSPTQPPRGVELVIAPQPSVVDMVTANVTTHSDIDNLVQNMSQLSGLTYSRQNSMEARWRDVEGLITGDPVIAGADATNATYTIDNATATALLQDASLALGRQNLNLTETMYAPGEELGSLNLNESQLLLNLTQEMPTLFPNNSLVTPPSPPTNASSLLSDILGEVNELNNISFHTQIDSNAGFQPIKYEDSDSAVGSLDSPSFSTMDSGDGRSNITSPFDGLEGATGGSDDASGKPAIKYDDPDQYPSYTMLDWEGSQLSTNSSGDQNDTDLGFTAANPRHVSHNHTYPLQPGQEPRESKSYPRSNSKGREALERKVQMGTNRDQRKAKLLKIPYTPAEIINSPVEKFNDMLTKYKFTDSQLQLIKDIRRRGKNKVAAQNCRKRKLEVIETLDDVVHRMRGEKEGALRRKAQMERERDKLRDKYNTLYRDVFRSLRDENGRPYDPNEYTLQHTADGSVFLMPRSQTGEQEPEVRRGRKRKGGDSKK